MQHRAPTKKGLTVSRQPAPSLFYCREMQASLTCRQESIVQRVPIGDRAASGSDRELNRGGASVHCLVDSPKHAPVSRVVLQSEDATLDGRLTDAGEGDADKAVHAGTASIQ